MGKQKWSGHGKTCQSVQSFDSRGTTLFLRLAQVPQDHWGTSHTLRLDWPRTCATICVCAFSAQAQARPSAEALPLGKCLCVRIPFVQRHGLNRPKPSACIQKVCQESTSCKWQSHKRTSVLRGRDKQQNTGRRHPTGKNYETLLLTPARCFSSTSLKISVVQSSSAQSLLVPTPWWGELRRPSKKEGLPVRMQDS